MGDLVEEVLTTEGARTVFGIGCVDGVAYNIRISRVEPYPGVPEGILMTVAEQDKDANWTHYTLARPEGVLMERPKLPPGRPWWVVSPCGLDFVSALVLSVEEWTS